MGSDKHLLQVPPPPCPECRRNRLPLGMKTGIKLPMLQQIREYTGKGVEQEVAAYLHPMDIEVVLQIINLTFMIVILGRVQKKVTAPSGVALCILVSIGLYDTYTRRDV